MAEEVQYLAVIGDLIGSRELADRAGAQELLFGTLERLNEEFSEFIVSRFVVTVGDEFQGLLAVEAPFAGLWWSFVYEMFPEVPARFGLGIGTLSTELREEALGMDGACFHAAREALSRAHYRNHFLGFARPGSPEVCRKFGSLWSLTDWTLKHWTAIQWENSAGFAVLGTQKKVSEVRGVTQQAVQASLAGAGGMEVMESLEAIVELFRGSSTGVGPGI